MIIFAHKHNLSDALSLFNTKSYCITPIANNEDVIFDDDQEDPRIIQTLDALCTAFTIAPESATRKHLPYYTTRADVNTWTDESSKSAKRLRKSVFSLYLNILRSNPILTQGCNLLFTQMCRVCHGSLD